MSEMVERVARAITDAIPVVGAMLGDAQKREVARRIIEAMREPTDGMMAALDCGGDKKTWESGKVVAFIWAKMIDEALK